MDVSREFRVQSGLAGQVAVIVVNYDTADLAVAAVESVISREHGGRLVEVHLVDNASPHGDATWLEREIADRGWTDRVTLYRERQNHGFGRGNNLVLRRLAARSEPPTYVFLLNPDARLRNEAIAILADFLDEHPEAAAAGCRTEAVDGEPIASAFNFPTIVATFSGALALGPVSRLLGRWEVPLPPAIPTSIVDWVAGAAVMLRLSSVQRAGLFDPAYFLYFEEVDLMRRISCQNETVWYVAEAHAAHMRGAATNVRSGGSARRSMPRYWYESWSHYFLKSHGRAGALLAALAWYAGALGNAVLSLPLRRTPAAPLQFYSDFWSFAVRPLLGLKAAARD